MGLFDFVKEAGAKVGIGESKAEKEAKATAASAERAAEVAEQVKARRTTAVKEARMERLAEDKKAAGLESYVKLLGLVVNDLDIRVDDDKAQVTGKVKDQDTREKVILAVGNVEGIAQVEDDIEVVEDSEESNMHVVQAGDTLSAIAKEHYGDANKYPAIFEANRPMLTDPDLIYPGQVLRIPADA